MRFMRLRPGRGLALELERRERAAAELSGAQVTIPESVRGAGRECYCPREEQARQLFLADEEVELPADPGHAAEAAAPPRNDALRQGFVAVGGGDRADDDFGPPRRAEVGGDSGSGPNSPSGGSCSTARRSKVRSWAARRTDRGDIRLSFDRAVVDQEPPCVFAIGCLCETARFRDRAGSDDRLDHDRGRRGRPGESRAGARPGDRLSRTGRRRAGLVRRTICVPRPAGERPLVQFVEQDAPGAGQSFTFKARALAQLALPPLSFRGC